MEKPTRLRPGRPSGARPRRPALPAAWLALALVVAACATNPVTGRREFSLVSADQEERIGREGYAAVLAEYGTYGDSTLQRYVDGIGQRMAKLSHLPNLDWHFTVLDDPAVNAFAMPGGYIYITRGILAHLSSEAQLAGVLGHEIAHVTHRHSAEALTRQQVTGIGLGVASILSSDVARYGQVAQQALGLMFLKYGRSAENEADALGVEYAIRAGYDPREIPATYAMLKRVGERAGQRLPAFLSTHPDPGDREVRTGELARAAAAGRTDLLTREGEYLQRLEGVVFGDDPRAGYFEGDDFYHPEMAFAMTFPAGWARQNARAAVTAAAPEQRAVMQLTLAEATDLSPPDYVARLTATGRISRSQGEFERVSGLPAWVGRVAVPAEAGTERVLAAAFIRLKPGRMIQILGSAGRADDPHLDRVLASARSLRPLTDAARLTPNPARVRVSRVANPGVFSALVSALGPQGLDLDGTAILNNRQPEERLAAGTALKTVTAPRLH